MNEQKFCHNKMLAEVYEKKYKEVSNEAMMLIIYLNDIKGPRGEEAWKINNKINRLKNEGQELFYKKLNVENRLMEGISFN
jgi:Txe/YoeB family toxin of Txe-Axe toxin-antitoxin module